VLRRRRRDLGRDQEPRQLRRGGLDRNADRDAELRRNDGEPARPGVDYAVCRSGADLEFSTLPGCTFKFNVSGNTATLANGPVSCSGTQQGVPFTTTVTSYTLTTADGHSMSVNSAATVVTGGQNCAATVAGTLSR